MPEQFKGRPDYLQQLKNAPDFDRLDLPTYVGKELGLNLQPFFKAIRYGLLPSYVIGGHTMVCPREIMETLTLINAITD